MGEANKTFKRNEAIVGMAKGSEILSYAFTKKLKSGFEGTDVGIYQGSIVLRALSIELSLKSILDEASLVYKKTHKIKDLFNDLPASMRDSILSEYTVTKNQRAEWPVLEELLVNVNDVFVDWRYAVLDTSALSIKIDAWTCFGNLLLKNLAE